jgi:tRNA nucleotidyltransferase (CCA-adding enzyme)
MNIPKDVLRIIDTLQKAGHKAYLVGGCVRDTLRRATPKDYDVATSARPEAVIELFARVVPTGIKHGTVTVFMENEMVEVTTFRGDGDYGDGRRPDSVTFLDSIEGDLARRDFTMNAIAFDPIANIYVDPFNGREAIEDRIIRCVGDPIKRFNEDGLRPLRAIRFAATLNYEIDAETYLAISASLETYEKVAIERVTEELKKILMSRSRLVDGLKYLVSSGLMRRIIPGFVEESAYELDIRFKKVFLSPFDFDLRLAFLFEGYEFDLQKLKLSTSSITRIQRLYATKPLVGLDKDDAKLREFVSKVGKENLSDVFAFQNVEFLFWEFKDYEKFLILKERIEQLLLENPPLSISELNINGDEVVAVVGRGKNTGVALKKLLGVVIQDPSKNTKPQLTEMLHTFVQENKWN